MARAGAPGTTAKKPASAKPSKTASTLAAGLEKLGLRRPLDFALHLPLRYEDQTRITLLSDAPAAGPALFAVRVRNVTVAFRPRRQLLVQVEDDSGRANLRFLNFYGSQTKQFERARDEGLTLHAWGELRSGYLGPELVHPTISRPTDSQLDSRLRAYSHRISLSKAGLVPVCEAKRSRTFLTVRAASRRRVDRCRYASVRERKFGDASWVMSLWSPAAC